MAAVLFVMRYPLHRGDNLKAKFDGQIAAVRALGHQAYWIGWDERGMWLMGGEQPERLAGAGFTHMPAYENTLIYHYMMLAVRRAVERHTIDMVYVRYMPFFRGAVRALRAAKARGAKLVLEHPTYPFERGKTTSALRKPVFWYCDRVFRYIEPMLDLYVLMGEDAHGSLNGVPALNVLNGVDAERYPLHEPRPQADELSLLALASMSDWQGYDRLIRALKAYQGAQRVVIHMVGNEGDGSLARWKKLTAQLGLEGRVLFHPAMHGEALDRFIEGCDVGVGGLGWYRKQSFVTNPLKLREYMARGLPFLYVPVAESIPDEPRYCLCVPNDDSPLDMAQIVDFGLRARGDALAPAEMRRYAKEHMSWRTILASILERAGIE